MEKVFKEVAVTGRPDLGGPFVLVDQRGEPVTDASYRGRSSTFSIINFNVTIFRPIFQ